MLQKRAFLINLNFLTGMYYHTSGKFLETLDCDGLKTPLHNVVQWQSISCFLMFIAVKIKVCRKSLKNTFMLIPDMFSFNLNTRLESYCQIFFQNFRLLESPNQGKDLSNCNGTRTQNHLNGWVFVYEVSGYGFESRCCHLNFRCRAYFEQEVLWHSGNCRL